MIDGVPLLSKIARVPPEGHASGKLEEAACARPVERFRWDSVARDMRGLLEELAERSFESVSPGPVGSDSQDRGSRV